MIQVGLSQFFNGLRFTVKLTWSPSHTVKSTRLAHSISSAVAITGYTNKKILKFPTNDKMGFELKHNYSAKEIDLNSLLRIKLPQG